VWLVPVRTARSVLGVLRVTVKIPANTSGRLYVDSLPYAFDWSAFSCRIQFDDILVVIFFNKHHHYQVIRIRVKPHNLNFAVVPPPHLLRLSIIVLLVK
jgi:hypothetical protein